MTRSHDSPAAALARRSRETSLRTKSEGSAGNPFSRRCSAARSRADAEESTSTARTAPPASAATEKPPEYEKRFRTRRPDASVRARWRLSRWSRKNPLFCPAEKSAKNLSPFSVKAARPARSAPLFSVRAGAPVRRGPPRGSPRDPAPTRSGGRPAGSCQTLPGRRPRGLSPTPVCLPSSGRERPYPRKRRARRPGRGRPRNARRGSRSSPRAGPPIEASGRRRSARRRAPGREEARSRRPRDAPRSGTPANRHRTRGARRRRRTLPRFRRTDPPPTGPPPRRRATDAAAGPRRRGPL